ncbi:MAG: hypothetical protein RIE52_05840, partial [Balneola sp.]
MNRLSRIQIGFNHNELKIRINWLSLNNNHDINKLLITSFYDYKSNRATPIFLILIFSINFAPKLIFSQDVTGFLRNYNAVLTSPPNEYLVGRNRLGVDISFNTNYGTVFISNEILNTYSKSANDYAYDFSEGYIDLFYKNSDLRIGKQVISHGRTNGTFITDILSPIDVSEFLTLSVEDLKGGIPAVKYTRYYGSNFLELIATPVFQSNTLAQPGSRWFPFTELEKSTNVTYADSLTENSFSSFQGMIKWGIRSSLKWDLDLTAMWWTEGNPSYEKDLVFTGPVLAPEPAIELTKTYLKSPIIGYSGNYILNDNLIIKSESAFHFKKYFDYLPELATSADLNSLTPIQAQQLILIFNQNEDGFLFEKPWLINMIGVKTSLSGLDIESQFFYEHIFKYDKLILQDENFFYSTLSLRKSFLRNNLLLSGFARYNYIGEDFWVNPEAQYDIKDGLEAALGFHFFGGKESENFYGHFNFKNYAASSFGYIKLTAYF